LDDIEVTDNQFTVGYFSDSWASCFDECCRVETGRYQDTRENQVDQELRTGGAQTTTIYTVSQKTPHF